MSFNLFYSAVVFLSPQYKYNSGGSRPLKAVTAAQVNVMTMEDELSSDEEQVEYAFNWLHSSRFSLKRNSPKLSLSCSYISLWFCFKISNYNQRFECIFTAHAQANLKKLNDWYFPLPLLQILNLLSLRCDGYILVYCLYQHAHWNLQAFTFKTAL